jgi:hypothetical protein
MAKKDSHTTTAYCNRRALPITRAWPTMTERTPRYIGLRTYRYKPETTRRTVGATGAGVPRPFTAKRTKLSTTILAPAPMRTYPSHGSTKAPNGAAWARHLVSVQGITPATVAGANQKKTNEPSRAPRLFTVHPRLVRSNALLCGAFDASGNSMHLHSTCGQPGQLGVEEIGEAGPGTNNLSICSRAKWTSVTPEVADILFIRPRRSTEIEASGPPICVRPVRKAERKP